MNILILGATGFLGRHLLKFLNDNHYEIFLLQADVNASDTYLVYDIDELDKLFSQKQIDWIINCVGVYENAGIEKMLDGNIMYPMKIFNCAIQHGVKNIMNINTSLPSNVNMYSATKRQLGNIGKFYAETFEINFYNLLVEMFYGPDEPKTRFITTVINKMLNNADVLLTEGMQQRDFVRVEDVCSAICFLLQNNIMGYNDIPIGTGEKHTIRETIEMLYEETDSKSRLMFGKIPMRQNEPDCVADMTLLYSLGYRNKFSWKTGLCQMVSEMRKNM